MNCDCVLLSACLYFVNQEMKINNTVYLQSTSQRSIEFLFMKCEHLLLLFFSTSCISTFLQNWCLLHTDCSTQGLHCQNRVSDLYLRPICCDLVLMFWTNVCWITYDGLLLSYWTDIWQTYCLISNHKLRHFISMLCVLCKGDTDFGISHWTVSFAHIEKGSLLTKLKVILMKIVLLFAGSILKCVCICSFLRLV